MNDMQLKQFNRSDPFEVIMDRLAEDGGVIVREFISADLLHRLNSELDADIKKTLPGSNSTDSEFASFWGSHTKRFTRLAARAPSFAELLDDDFMHAWASRTLKQGYWLNTGQVMIVGPGEKQQVLHRDLAPWPMFIEAGKDGPEALVSILVALSDFTEEIGATRVVPGSHRWDNFTPTEVKPIGSVAAVMPAGSALLYTGKTIHGAGANVTENLWRQGLHMSFVLGWLTPEEASPVGVSWEIARTYPERVQRMLGYVSPRHRPEMVPMNWLVDFQDASLHVKRGVK